ncbi:DUF6894 family protein [Allosphingosinicella deserti]|uniref:DUF6894 domain-containing protein n=1 Tax=Allosphingosinicella deserti TaxID=2116704 RepID=A0A2P7QF04_9SPHN|nr:hypothetical protein [Sphingomonas deserti]PSJ36561.1 hypothetical protein C7I55_26210 [Sphingomonas deserti]
MRYFFNTADGSHDRDEVGADLPDHNAARAMAVKVLAECLQSDPTIIWQGHEFRVEATDDHGSCSFMFPWLRPMRLPSANLILGGAA